jgi:elongation factor G
LTINDGQTHNVDSSDNAFQAAARGAFRQAYAKASPVVLEPVMKVALEGPVEFHGAMVTTLVQRRGMVLGSTEVGGFSEIEAEVPLSEMFGYATVLRSTTQGRAEFTMEFARYSKAPNSVAEVLIKAYQSEGK